MSAAALLRAEAGSAPSGTGSFSYFSHFLVVVENLRLTSWLASGVVTRIRIPLAFTPVRSAGQYHKIWKCGKRVSIARI